MYTTFRFHTTTTFAWRCSIACCAQVLGHTKTIAVLLASWWVFHEPMVPRKLLGIALAVAGMTAYGHAAASAASTAARKQACSSKKRDDAGADADGKAQVLLAAGGAGGVKKVGPRVGRRVA